MAEWEKRAPSVRAPIRRETTEQMLSRMAAEREENDALQRGMTVKQMRAMRRKCAHVWETVGLYDNCTKCGEGRA